MPEEFFGNWKPDVTLKNAHSSSDRAEYLVVDADDDLDVIASVEYAGEERTEARLRLFAQAPKLYDACRALLGIDNPPAGDPRHIDYGDAVRMGREAIAKVKGQ